MNSSSYTLVAFPLYIEIHVYHLRVVKLYELESWLQTTLVCLYSDAYAVTHLILNSFIRKYFISYTSVQLSTVIYSTAYWYILSRNVAFPSPALGKCHLFHRWKGCIFTNRAGNMIRKDSWLHSICLYGVLLIFLRSQFCYENRGYVFTLFRNDIFKGKDVIHLDNLFNKKKICVFSNLYAILPFSDRHGDKIGMPTIF